MPILITDFDGTFAQRDFFDLILEKFDPPGAEAGWQQFLSGEITLSEGLNAVFNTLRTDTSGAADLVEALNPALGTAEAVRALQKAGWEIIIASAGCRWYIDCLLAQQGIAMKVHASPGVFTPQSGLLMTPDPTDQYYHPKTGIDKPLVVKAALQRDPIVAYAGDSITDRAGALMVPPQRRFVTGWLQHDFETSDVAHVPFKIWPEIAAHLLDQ